VKRRAILSFDSYKNREDFFAAYVLEKHAISENTMDTNTDCSIQIDDADGMRDIVEEAKSYGADVHTDCGGNSLSSCSDYERSNGTLCMYCQYCEFK